MLLEIKYKAYVIKMYMFQYMSLATKVVKIKYDIN